MGSASTSLQRLPNTPDSPWWHGVTHFAQMLSSPKKVFPLFWTKYIICQTRRRRYFTLRHSPSRMLFLSVCRHAFLLSFSCFLKKFFYHFLQGRCAGDKAPQLSFLWENVFLLHIWRITHWVLNSGLVSLSIEHLKYVPPLSSLPRESDGAVITPPCCIGWVGFHFCSFKIFPFVHFEDETPRCMFSMYCAVFSELTGFLVLCLLLNLENS